jgi:HEAT repeat protein
VDRIWANTPRQSIEAECERRGREAFIRGCIDLLEGREADDSLIVALGGPHAENVLGGAEGGKNGYWPRVWAARGLLYAWDGEATSALVRATSDESWRVREMAAKLAARHCIGEALDAVARLRDDPVQRVRLAAKRAVINITSAGA